MHIHIITMAPDHLQPVYYEYVQAFLHSCKELGVDGHSVRYVCPDAIKKVSPRNSQELLMKDKVLECDILFVIVGVFQCLSFSSPVIEKAPFKIAILFETLHHIVTPEQHGLNIINSSFDYTFSVFQANDKYITNPFVHVPIGWSPIYEYHGTKKVEQLIPATFVGQMNGLRLPTIYDLDKKLLVSFGFMEGRDFLILSTKVNVILKRFKFAFFTSLRYYLIASKMGFVLTEPFIDYDNLVPNRHFIESNNLEKDIDYWVEHEEERRNFAECAYADLKANYPYTKFLEAGFKQAIIL